MKKLNAIAAIIIFTAWMLPGCTPKPVSQTRFLLDTAVTITVYEGPDVIDMAFALAARLEKVFSAADPQSELSRLNAAGTGVVSQELAEVLTVATLYQTEFNGAFNPFLLPCTELWDFKSDHPSVPDAQAVAEALKQCGGFISTDGVNIDMNGCRADLGGIAKGWIQAQVRDLLVEQGVKNALLSFGGSITAIGDKCGEQFRIGVKNPAGEPYLLLMSDRSVVTSGIYERGFEADGVSYHHVLDPATGYPAQSRLAGVSVLCSDPAWGDAASTALLVMGDGAKEFAAAHGISAVFVMRDGSVETVNLP